MYDFKSHLTLSCDTIPFQEDTCLAPGKRSGVRRLEAVTQESTSRDNGTNRERPKKAFVRQRERERERRLIRSGVGANIRKGATILGEDRTMAFWRVSGTPTRPRTMH